MLDLNEIKNNKDTCILFLRELRRLYEFQLDYCWIISRNECVYTMKAKMNRYTKKNKQS